MNNDNEIMEKTESIENIPSSENVTKSSDSITLEDGSEKEETQNNKPWRIVIRRKVSSG